MVVLGFSVITNLCVVCVYSSFGFLSVDTLVDLFLSGLSELFFGDGCCFTLIVLPNSFSSHGKLCSNLLNNVVVSCPSAQSSPTWNFMLYVSSGLVCL